MVCCQPSASSLSFMFTKRISFPVNRFFVNLHSGKSQWEAPEGPARPEGQHAPPSGPPPSYEQSGPGNPAAVASAGDTKRPLSSNNPYYNDNNQASTATTPSIDEDARLAARLQAEEDARAGTKSPAATRGSAADFYNEAPPPQAGYAPPRPSSSSQSPVFQGEQSKSRGFLSKLIGKSSGSSHGGYGSPRPPQYGYQGYPQGGYPPGGYPPQPPAGYGYPGYGYPPQGVYYPPQQQAPPRKSGMGAGAAAALGVGGGLIGGALLADAIEDHDESVYDAGYDAGYDDGGFDDF